MSSFSFSEPSNPRKGTLPVQYPEACQLTAMALQTDVGDFNPQK